MVKDLLIFDMDGVLVDVTDSYREGIKRSVEFFTGTVPTSEFIQTFKNAGGWNDDWALTQHLIKLAGHDVRYEVVVDYFNSIFFGSEGLIQRERWQAKPGLLERLAQWSTLSVFTGRLNWEAQITLNRFAPGQIEHVIGVDDVGRHKPDPEGIAILRERIPHKRVFYMGDTADDAIAARSAAVPFIGVLGSRTPNRPDAVKALRGFGAVTIVETINELEGVLEDL